MTTSFLNIWEENKSRGLFDMKKFVKIFPVLSKGFEIKTEMNIHAVDKNMYVENVIAAILAGISIWFFALVMENYKNTGLAPEFPTLMVCGFTMIAAIQSLFAGMQLQIIVQKNRQDFEMNLHRLRMTRSI